MKTAVTLSWILGATLVVMNAGARSWAEYERQEGTLSFIEARELSPMDPMLQARLAGTAITAAAVNVATPAADTVILVLRDSDFQELKDVTIGDLVELGTLELTQFNRITDLSVVDPRDVDVLDDTGESVLTRVTCHPFYFVGDTPQGFIVRAVAADGVM